MKVFFGQPLGGLDSKGLGTPIGQPIGGSNPPTPGGCSPVNNTFCDPKAPNPPATTPGTPSAFGTPNGAGPIMGVGSSATGNSILEINEQTTYDTWEFLYDPRIELLYKQGQAAGGGIGTALPPPPKSTLTPNDPTPTKP